MSAITDRITEVLRKGWDTATGALSRDEWVAHVAGRIETELTPAIPDRQFTDDIGRRWEWCGGQPGTWAWRTTGGPA